MKKQDMIKGLRRSIIVFPALLLFFADCGTKRETVLVDGSSTVYVITEAVAEDFIKENRNISVTVGISGTGGGFKKFCNGELDIADASRRIKESEVKDCGSKNIEFVEIPVAYDGMSVVVNPKNSFVDKLSVADLDRIFNEKKKAQTWKDINPKWPNQKIKVYSPGHDSGTYDYFAEEILGKNEAVRSDALFSEDDNVLVTGISGDENSIGYFGLAYYEENRERVKLVPVVNPASQKAVVPETATVRSGEYAPLSRPLYIYVKKTSMERDSVRNFILHYLSTAEQLSGTVGYIPLMKSEYDKHKMLYTR
jgi:phosphate transport system substrate-binding protein